jgi:hypothetical protein
MVLKRDYMLAVNIMVKLKPCMMKEVTLLMLLVLQPVSVLGLDGANCRR